VTFARVALLLAFALVPWTAARADETPIAYALPEGFDAPKLDPAIDDAVRAAVATILDPIATEDADDAARLLAGVGRGALPRLVGGMTAADWRARAALVAAAGEMDAPDATPFLVAAASDPAFAVRGAAVVGLGKTGDARGSAALLERSKTDVERAWPVRVAAAAALRRAVLRGVLERSAGEAALATLLTDPDDDVRRAALREIAPLSVGAALPAILDVFADPKTPPADRTLALAALRAYREPTPALVAALKRGLVSDESASEACEAGRALLAMRGADALADEEVSAAVMTRLTEGDHDSLHDGIARLGRAALPWLLERARATASRIAEHRGASYDDTPLDELIDIVVQIDESAGVAFLAELLDAKSPIPFDEATQRAALRRIEVAFAPKMRAVLRARYDAGASSLCGDLLRAIVASGGDDVAARLDAALGVKEARRQALDLLHARTDVAVGPRLLAMASEEADETLRRQALDVLSQRDPERAAAIASSLLDDPRAAMRSKAISLLAASEDPKAFDRLVARLTAEDGADAPAPPPPGAGGDRPKGAGTTPSEPVAEPAGKRGRLVRELVDAVAKSDPARARPVLLHVAESDADALVRAAAAQRLAGSAVPEDAPRLVAAEKKEEDVAARRELLAAIATLGAAPEAVRRFDELTLDAKTREIALSLLSREQSSVVPDTLLAGIGDPSWTDDERRSALVTLVRAGRAPDVGALAALVVDARTLDLSAEAANALAASKAPEASAALVALLAKLTDPERLSAVVQAVGSFGPPDAETPLLEIFAKTRDRAFAATSSSEASVDLYRRCADAVAAFGSPRTGGALVAHLFDPRLVRSAARCSSLWHGPFQPDNAAPIAILRTLVAALARRDDDACGRLVSERLAALAADGRDLELPEGWLAGVARYLEDPYAYDLPARPRPQAALALWRLVLKNAPRMSEFDASAWQALDEHLGEAKRWRDAGQALRAAKSLADVEDAARPRTARLLEDARIAVRDAQALADGGDVDGALALARSLRRPDETNGELAYRAGYCLVALGRADAEARNHLVFAAAQDGKDARIHFYLGWTAERMNDPRGAVSAYEQAVALDRRRVEQRRSDDLAGFRGAPHESAAYAYWLARALRAAGNDDRASGFLTIAVSYDDRLAAQARADSAFAGWDRLDAAVRDGLKQIRAGALR